MPSLDSPDGPLVETLRSAFAPQLENGEVDLAVLRNGTDVEIQADEWTLHLEGWPVVLAFIALEDEPASVAEQESALDAVLDSQAMAALRTANRDLCDAIVTALRDSGDEVSAVLADAISGPPEGLLDSLDE